MKKFTNDGLPPDGEWVFCRKITPVQMMQMSEPFEVESREGLQEGKAGDWIVPDGHGGYYVVSAQFHALNYGRWS